MSNQFIDARGMTAFLERLGRCYRHAGVLYLVGGSSLLLLDAKESTLDIDVQFEVLPEHHAEFLRCLRQISREMNIPVEQASPEQFIPLPSGYRERRIFIDRFGQLDVFHFDVYSISLAKLDRGHEKDFSDVINMVKAKVIEVESLERYYAEILPKFEMYSLETDAEGFKNRFVLFKQRLTEMI